MNDRWKDKCNRELITSGLQKIKIVDPKTGKLEGFEGPEYEDYISVIQSQFEFDSTIPDFERGRIIRSSVRTLCEKNSLNPKTLTSELLKNENLYLKKPEKEFVLITSLSFSYFSGLKNSSISYRDTSGGAITSKKIRIQFSRDIPNGYDRNVVLEKVKDKYFDKLPTQYTYARVSIPARTGYEAASKALDSLDLLRGIWNLHLNSNGHHRRRFHKREPLNQLLLGPVHTIHESNGKLAAEDFWYEPEYVSPEKCFDLKQTWVGVKEWEDKAKKLLRNHTYRNEVEEGFRMYTRATDTRDYNSSFLGLWRVIEFLTSTSQARYDMTVRRASFLWGDAEFHRQVLEHLRTYRNQAVHAGKQADEIETFLYQIERYAKILIYYHIGNPLKAANMKAANELLDQPITIDSLNAKQASIKQKQALINYTRKLKGWG